MANHRPELHIGPPRWFGTRQAVVSFLCSQLLQAICLLMLLGVCLWAADNGGLRVGWVWLASLMMLGIILAGMLYMLPFLAGNDYISSLVSRHTRHAHRAPNATICQVTLVPRVRGAFRGFIDDADDVGVLTWNDESLAFYGDSIQFSIPFTHLHVETSSAGWRGMWLIGRKVRLTIWGLTECDAVVVMDRTGSTTPAARKASRRLVNALKHGVARAGKAADAQFNVELPEPYDGTAPQRIPRPRQTVDR